VPLGKIIAYYSDAYHAEYILPKFRMYRYELASALAERMERSEEHPNMVPLSFAEALDIAEALLVRNPCSLFEGG
jgi:phosphoribosyl 1,2-cyclic phosphodiesterase